MIDEKWTIKRIIWFSLGMLSLGMAYIGVVTPGIPFSIFLVFAAYCFAKSSKKWHDWIYNHKYFGPFLTNWVNYRVFHFYAKIMQTTTHASYSRALTGKSTPSRPKVVVTVVATPEA